jgi:hypothetical protein
MKVRRNELSRPENIMDYVKDPTKGVVYAKNPDGTDQLVYEGDNVRFCVRRPGEMCTICGLCFGGLADEAAI